jgi:hypothetical protein
MRMLIIHNICNLYRKLAQGWILGPNEGRPIDPQLIMPKQQPWRDGQQHEGYIVKGDRCMPVFLNANQAI